VKDVKDVKGPKSLEGKVAVVTASTLGIGRGIAEAFLHEGARVVLNGRDKARGDTVLRELGAGERAVFAAGDVTRLDDVERLVLTAVERYGRLDILVNNAGGASRPAPVVETTDEEWDLVLRWNLSSTFWGTRAALRHMLPQRAGRIINISSVEGKQGKPALAPYVAAKHAVCGLTKAVAREAGPSGVTVNSICPGLVVTDIIRRTGPKTAEAMGITYDELIAMYAKESALGRPNTVAEVAALAVFLAGEQAAGINGALLSVDGGTAAY
jgi:3-hydroxybutyrate dehydrogenase